MISVDLKLSLRNFRYAYATHPAISPNIYNSRICPDGRKIVVISGIEIAQNDRQVKKKFII